MYFAYWAVAFEIVMPWVVTVALSGGPSASQNSKNVGSSIAGSQFLFCHEPSGLYRSLVNTFPLRGLGRG